MSDNNQEKPYLGLFGLDNIHPSLKVINFLISVCVGGIIAFGSWFQELNSNPVAYQFNPFSWPLIFLFAWPTCAAILWLRLTGLKWRWGFLAAALIFFIYFVLTILVYVMIGMNT